MRSTEYPSSFNKFSNPLARSSAGLRGAKIEAGRLRPTFQALSSIGKLPRHVEHAFNTIVRFFFQSVQTASLRFATFTNRHSRFSAGSFSLSLSDTGGGLYGTKLHNVVFSHCALGLNISCIELQLKSNTALQLQRTFNEKTLRETQTLHAGCSGGAKNFRPTADPLLGARDGQNLISWRWSLPLPTNPDW